MTIRHRFFLASRPVAKILYAPVATSVMSSNHSNTSRGVKTQAHYEAHSTDSYEDAYFYEPGAYTDYLKNLVQNRLRLNQNLLQRTLLDLGGGTGNFTQMIVDGTQTKAIVVDPFLAENNATNKDDKKLQFVRAPAEVFKEAPNEEDHWWRQGYHQVLLKEVIHHIGDADRVAVFRGIRNGLVDIKDMPSLLIITRPQLEIDYRIWPAAKIVWAKNQPSSETLTKELRDAGFTKVDQSIEAFPCSIPLDRWLGMIKQRFWSTFSSFSDEELEAACKLVAETESDRLDEQGCLHFEDRLVFLAAHK